MDRRYKGVVDILTPFQLLVLMLFLKLFQMLFLNIIFIMTHILSLSISLQNHIYYFPAFFLAT